LPSTAIVNEEFNEVARQLPWHGPECRKLVRNPWKSPRSRGRLELKWQSCNPALSPWQQNFGRLLLPSAAPILLGSGYRGWSLQPFWTDSVRSDMMDIAEWRTLKRPIE
jgi:hypothetical protein